MEKIILISSKGRVVRVFQKGGLVPTLSHGTVYAQSSASTGRLDALSIAPPAPEVVAQMTFNETPSGIVDGANDTFSLSRTPTNLMLFKNGMLQKEGVGNDYTLIGNIIVFEPQNIPPIGSNLIATLVSE